MLLCCRTCTPPSRRPMWSDASRGWRRGPAWTGPQLRLWLLGPSCTRVHLHFCTQIITTIIITAFASQLHLFNVFSERMCQLQLIIMSQLLERPMCARGLIPLFQRSKCVHLWADFDQGDLHLVWVNGLLPEKTLCCCFDIDKACTFLLI